MKMFSKEEAKEKSESSKKKFNSDVTFFSIYFITFWHIIPLFLWRGDFMLVSISYSEWNEEEERRGNTLHCINSMTELMMVSHRMY